LLPAAVFGLEYGALGTGSLIWRAGRERLIAWNAGSLPFYVALTFELVVAALLLPRLTATPWGLPRRADAAAFLCLALALSLNALGGAILSGRIAHVHLHAPISPLGFLAGAVLAPITEEWLFRGMVFETARTMLRGGRLAMVVPVVISAILFALWHLPFNQDPYLLYNLGFGATLAIARWRLSSIVPGIGIHFLGNAFNLVS
jgi:membrane protease YdiL (CAAX protease family)